MLFGNKKELRDIRVYVVGDDGTGKTSLISALISSRPEEDEVDASPSVPSIMPPVSIAEPEDDQDDSQRGPLSIARSLGYKNLLIIDTDGTHYLLIKSFIQ